jgi:hypothetical protein
MKTEPKAIRGIFEKVPGSKVWWVRYADANGKIRREKVGNKGVATKLYQKRRRRSCKVRSCQNSFELSV